MNVPSASILNIIVPPFVFLIPVWVTLALFFQLNIFPLLSPFITIGVTLVFVLSINLSVSLQFTIIDQAPRLMKMNIDLVSWLHDLHLVPLYYILLPHYHH